MCSLHPPATSTSESKRPKRYPCKHEGCGKRYSRPCLVRQHERSHYDDRSFMCSYPGCGKGFLRNSHLKVHMLTHKTEKPHVCPHCGKGFNTGQQILRHLKAHRNKATRTYRDKSGAEATATKTEALEFEQLMASPTDPLFGMAQLVYSQWNAPDFGTSNDNVSTSTGSETNGDFLSVSELVSDSATNFTPETVSSGFGDSISGSIPDAYQLSISGIPNPSIVPDAFATSTSSSFTNPALGAGQFDAPFKVDSSSSSQLTSPSFPDLFSTSSILEDGQVWWCKDDACSGVIGYGSLGELITHYDVSHHYVPEDLHILFEDIVSRPPADDLDPNTDLNYFFSFADGCPFEVHLNSL